MVNNILSCAAWIFTILSALGVIATLFLGIVVQSGAGFIAYGALTAMYIWVAIGLWIEKEAERQRCEIRWSKQISRPYCCTAFGTPRLSVTPGAVMPDPVLD